jgi:AraC-like DNA-binding protein
MYVSIAMVRVIVAELHRQGIAEASFLAIADVRRDELADPTRLIPVGRYDEIVRVAHRMSGDPDLGLHVGDSAPTGGAHVVGQILYHCSSVRDAIALFIRYAPLVFEGARLALREEAGSAGLSWAHPAIAADNARFDAELAVALIFGIGRRFLRTDHPPYRVRFAHPRPRSIDEHRRLFRCELEFGAPVNEIVFAPRLLDLPHVYRDEPLCELLKERADALLARRRSDDCLSERVLDLLKYGFELGVDDLEEIAHRLGMSVRSLQRRLGERGESLSRLFDEARKEIACTALARPEDPIKDLAARLGFSEPSAFHRAFKRWTGTTPAEFRRRATSAGGSRRSSS